MLDTEIFIVVAGRYGVWGSLRTTNREALKRLRVLEERGLAVKALGKIGLVARLQAIEQKISESLAPWSAKEERGDFSGRVDECISRMQELSARTKTMWRTQRNNLVKLLFSISEIEKIFARQKGICI